MNRTDVIAVLTSARKLLVERGHHRSGGPMRTADGAHATRPHLAATFSITGAIMAAADDIGAPWAVGAADDAIRAVQVAALGESSQRGRAYLDVADWNDALPADEARARAIAAVTEAIGVVNGSKKPRAVRQGDAA